MKTDHPIYLFLSAGAEAFRVLTGGRRLVGAYRFCSLTIKGLERRLDAIFEPEGHAGPVYVVEFQGQAAYSTPTGHPFQRKLDTRSTPTWTVGAKRRAGWMLFTLGWVPPSTLVEVCAGIPRRD